MPEIPNVVAGELIEANWGNPIRDRTVQRYTSTGDRDSLHPSPAAGDLAWIGNDSEIQFYDGSTWQTVVQFAAPGLASYLPLTGGVLSGTLTGTKFLSEVTGGASAPVYGWNEDSPNPGDSLMGMFRSGENLRFTVDAAWRLQVTADRVETVVQITTPEGSAAAPAFAFTGAKDKGMFGPAANQLGFATGGTERLLIVNGPAHQINGGPLRAIHQGTDAPLDSLGENGDLYVQR